MGCQGFLPCSTALSRHQSHTTMDNVLSPAKRLSEIMFNPRSTNLTLRCFHRRQSCLVEVFMHASFPEASSFTTCFLSTYIGGVALAAQLFTIPTDVQ